MRGNAMDEIVKIAVDEFEKKPDGSWISVKNSDIITKAGSVVRITPGLTFKKGINLWELDVAQALDNAAKK